MVKHVVISGQFVVILVVLLCLFFVYACLAKDYVISPNEASRLATVYALAEQGTFIIDQTPFSWTIDKIKIDNHYYSDKPPLLSLIMTVLYLLMKQRYNLNLLCDQTVLYYGMVLILSVLPALLTNLFCTLVLIQLRTRTWLTVLCVLVCGLATLVLPYALVLNNQIIASCLITALFLLMIKSSAEIARTISTRGSLQLSLLVFLIGLLSGLCFAIDHLSGLIFPGVLLGALSCTILRSSGTAALKVFLFLLLLIGLIIFLVPHFWMNHYISGSYVPLSQQYQAYKYPGSRLDYETPAGKLAHSSLFNYCAYLFHLLFGIRGLFSYTPFLLIGLASLVQQSRNQKSELICLHRFFLLGLIAYIFLVSLISKNYGGSAYGVRWFLPFTPLLVIYAGMKLEAMKITLAWKIIIIALIVISLCTAFVGTIEPWTQLHGCDFTFYNNLRLIL
ncbi:hypothetical protein JXQ70_18200 [bacterium]|nr:hypothetical protein [bacterium]